MITLRSALAVVCTSQPHGCCNGITEQCLQPKIANSVKQAWQETVTRSRQAWTRAEGGRMLTRCPSCSGP